jgi:hypothetical protein
MTAKASILTALAVLLLNVVGAIGYFAVAYHPHTVSSEIALLSLYYILWIGWPLSLTALTLSVIAGIRARTWTPVGMAICSLLPYAVIVAAVCRGAFPSM